MFVGGWVLFFFLVLFHVAPGYVEKLDMWLISFEDCYIVQ